VYVVSEAESLIFGGFRDEGTFKLPTEMLSRKSRTNPFTWEVT